MELNYWWIWMILAALFVVGEIFTAGFFLLWFGIGAAVSGVIALLGLGITGVDLQQLVAGAAVDDALGVQRGGVGPGLGLGQGEARDLVAAAEKRQVALALGLGSDLEEKLSGPHRVGDQHHCRERRRARAWSSSAGS